MTKRVSIRKRLLLVVGLGIALVTIFQVIVAYRVALDEVDTIGDFHMVEMARAVRRNMPVSGIQIVPVPGTSLMPASEANCFTLRVQRTGMPAGPLSLLQRSRRHFSMREEGGKKLRVLYAEAPGIQIEISHDLAIRAKTARDLAVRTILPVLIVAPVLLLCVWLGIGHALRPLRKSRAEIAGCKGGELEALGTESVPDEVLPFVEEINVLFRRINSEFEARRNFVADVAHELRSPLAALSLQVQGLQRAQTDEARAQASGRVMGGIARATRLVEQLLVLAREEAAPRTGEWILLPQVLRLALSDVLSQAQARNIDLGADLQEHLPESLFAILGNSEALRTLLRNLLDNAVKYTPEGGRIDVCLQLEEQALVLHVEDSGPGIPVGERARIFERFRRGRSGRNAGGSGLGLAIVGAIASNHGIEIELGRSAKLGGLALSLRFTPAASAAQV